MTWRLDISRSAEKFIEKNRLPIDEVREHIAKAIEYFRGEDVNVDIKKLKGKWAGFIEFEAGAYALLPSLILITRLFLLKRLTGAEMFIEGVMHKPLQKSEGDAAV